MDSSLIRTIHINNEVQRSFPFWRANSGKTAYRKDSCIRQQPEPEFDELNMKKKGSEGMKKRIRKLQ